MSVSKARTTLKKLASWKSGGAIVLAIIGIGWMAKSYDSHLATKDELGTVQSTQAAVITNVASLKAEVDSRINSVESNMREVRTDLRLISAQLVEIAKTTGARQVLPPPAVPATTTP